MNLKTVPFGVIGGENVMGVGVGVGYLVKFWAQVDGYEEWVAEVTVVAGCWWREYFELWEKYGIYILETCQPRPVTPWCHVPGGGWL